MPNTYFEENLSQRNAYFEGTVIRRIIIMKHLFRKSS